MRFLSSDPLIPLLSQFQAGIVVNLLPVGSTGTGCTGEGLVLCIKYGSSRTLNQLAGNCALHAQQMRMCLKLLSHLGMRF